MSEQIDKQKVRGGGLKVLVNVKVFGTAHGAQVTPLLIFYFCYFVVFKLIFG